MTDKNGLICGHPWYYSKLNNNYQLSLRMNSEGINNEYDDFHFSSYEDMEEFVKTADHPRTVLHRRLQSLNTGDVITLLPFGDRKKCQILVVENITRSGFLRFKYIEGADNRVFSDSYWRMPFIA